MADNVITQSATLATPPASTIIATDQIPGTLEHIQLVKLVDGTADSTARITGDATNGLKVNVTNGSIAVTGTFWQATQPISAASLPLPTGASTEAKQPALGTAGTASADVITVQGIASMTPLLAAQSGTWTVDTELTTADLDTGAGTDTRAVVGLVIAKSGGAANVSSTDPLPVTVISGGGGGTQYAEDAAHASGDIGTLALVRRADTTSSSSGTDGDYSTLNVDKDGRLYVRSGLNRANRGKQQTTITTSTAETTIVTAAGVSTFADLYGLVLTNTGSTGTKVTIKDSTAGTTQMVLYVPPLSTVGFTVDSNDAIPQTTANNNWTATCGSSTSSLEVTALYVKMT